MELASLSICLFSFINISKQLNIMTDFADLFFNMETILALKMSKTKDVKSLAQVMQAYSTT